MKYFIFCLLFTSILSACAGDSSSPDIVKSGYGESELYHPENNPNGHIIPAETATTVLFLESPTVSHTSEGDTASHGTDEIYFDLQETTTYMLELTPDLLTIISAVSIFDQNDTALITVNEITPQASVELSPGRYTAHFTANHTVTSPPPVFIQMNNSSPRKAQKPTRATTSELVDWLISHHHCGGCDLRGVDLSYRMLDGVFLDGANFTDAKLVYTFFKSASFTAANFTRAKMESINARFATFYGANFTNANLRNADLRETNSENADMTNAYLAGAKLDNAKLKGATLISANLDSAKLVDADLRESNFTDAILTRAMMQSVQMNDGIMKNADLTGAGLQNSTIQNTDMTDTTLKQANMSDSTFIDTDFSGANLTDANLSGTHYYGNVLFSGATWTDGTVCANGSVNQCN